MVGVKYCSNFRRKSWKTERSNSGSKIHNRRFPDEGDGWIDGCLGTLAKAMVPSLLSGAGNWTGDIKDAVEKGDKLQNYFWRVILSVPELCPKIALRSELK